MGERELKVKLNVEIHNRNLNNVRNGWGGMNVQGEHAEPGKIFSPSD